MLCFLIVKICHNVSPSVALPPYCSPGRGDSEADSGTGSVCEEEGGEGEQVCDRGQELGGKEK